MGPQLRGSTDLLHTASTGYTVANYTLYTKNGRMRPTDLEALTCGICSKILRQPIQLITCGCRYCEVCIQKLMDSSYSFQEKFYCPADGDAFTKTDIRKDKGCMKELRELEVDCSAPVPCGWRGELVLIEKHQQEDCPNSRMTCKMGCGSSFLRSLDAEHLQECPKREEPCKFCCNTVPRDEILVHYASCPSHPVTCDFCNEAIPYRKEFERHLEEVCTECELNCPMAKSLGCSFKGKRTDMSQHTINAHLLNVLEKFGEISLNMSTMKASNEDLRKQIKEKDKKIENLEKRITKVESLVSSRSSDEDSLETDGVKTQNASHRGGRYTGDDDVKKSPSSYDSLEPYEISLGGKGASNVAHMLRESVNRHDNQITRLHESMQGIQQNMTQYSISVDELRLRQDIQEVKTTHGVFVWKIPDVRRRYRDALDCKTISLYSPPFQTSPHGYRMCVRAYLNGDGSGKGTYISLFFVLMHSDHDDLLTFPFKQSVRFTLVNQVNREESITEAFAPDLKSQSFQKPEGEMNVASGFPKFARQTVLQDERFTKGNVIYIKAQVDLSGLVGE